MVSFDYSIEYMNKPKTKRNNKIYAQHKKGRSSRLIGEKENISHNRVLQIINKIKKHGTNTKTNID